MLETDTPLGIDFERVLMVEVVKQALTLLPLEFQGALCNFLTKMITVSKIGENIVYLLTNIFVSRYNIMFNITSNLGVLAIRHLQTQSNL